MRFSGDVVGQKQALRVLKRLGTVGQQAMVRATNNAGRRAATLSNQEIRQQVNLKAGYVRERLKTQKATRQRVQFVISANRRGVLMTRYPFRATKSGVRVRIKRGGAARVIEGGFVAVLRAGGRRVPVIAAAGDRDSSGRRKRYRTGNPTIKVFYAPSVSQVFNKTRDKVTPRVTRYYEEQIDKELVRALKRIERA